MHVPSLSSPGYSVWILISRGHDRFVNEIHRHNSEIVCYSSPLRTKEENFDNVGFEPSKLAVVNHCQGSQDSNNARTKNESPRCGKSRPRKAAAEAAAAAAIPCQYIREQSEFFFKKEIPEEDRILTFILGCQKCKRYYFETRISKCVTNTLRHHVQDERETDGAMHWNVILPVLKGRFQNQLEKDFTRIGSIAFILEASRRGLKSVKMINENWGIFVRSKRAFRWNDYFTETDELRNDSPQIETIHLPRGLSARSILCSRSQTCGRRKRTQGRKGDNFLHSSWSFQ